MKSYKHFINENIRDKMIPKSEEDILKIFREGINSKRVNGLTPLTYASIMGNIRMIKSLIKDGADIDGFDDFGFTPLMRATDEPMKSSDEHNTDIVTHEQYKEIVKMLIESGADVNIVDKTRKVTALTYSVRQGNIDVVKILLDNGASKSINIKNDWGESPLELAQKYNRKDIEKILLEYETT